jgi:hypothetical protein
LLPATVVCLALLALLTVVQVAHLHPFDQDADHCPLCIVMQTAAPVAIAAAAVVLVALGALLAQPEPAWVTRSPQVRLFIRPPPSAL